MRLILTYRYDTLRNISITTQRLAELYTHQMLAARRLHSTALSVIYRNGYKL